MKGVLVLLLTFISIVCSAQDSISAIFPYFPINESGHIEYSEVIDSKLKKTTIMSNAKLWIAKLFGNYNSVVKLVDDEGGDIILKGSFDFKTKTEYPPLDKLHISKVSFSMEIKCKDEKYKYTIGDIKYKDKAYSKLIMQGDDGYEFYDTHRIGENIMDIKKSFDYMVATYSETNKLDKVTVCQLLETDVKIFNEIGSYFNLIIESLKSEIEKNNDF